MADLVGEIIEALEKPSAYFHPVGPIQRIITGVSVVFLTGDFAYKFNKPLNLGFLDFSTLEKRKDQCEKEFRYNSLISPDLYLGVSTINLTEQGNISVDGPGKVIEYAVKMKQLDPSLIMSELLAKNKISSEHLHQLAQKIFDFHQRAITDEETASFGSVEMVQFNWDENFEQTEKYQQTIISKEDFQLILEKINHFIKNSRGLFTQRVEKNKIKHCHGDFHSANVFVTPEIYIFDGIVFNKRFPCSDVIAEIAFMAMDLDFHGRKDLAEIFVKEYQGLSEDEDIPRLLDFYKCYRAYIRGKINCFTSEDVNLTGTEKQKAINDAKKYFKLAKSYAESF
ncbi:MAG: gluconokinase [Nanoarchaeota archaeon]